jgi:flagellar protein FlbD
MILLTRLNDRRFIANAEQIKTIEETPDTLITLLNGDQLLVKEPLAEVVRMAIEYHREIRTFQMIQAPDTATAPDKNAATAQAQ